MLHDENFNPLESIYVVDVKLQTVNDKLAAYKIIKLHEILKNENLKRQIKKREPSITKNLYPPISILSK